MKIMSVMNLYGCKYTDLVYTANIILYICHNIYPPLDFLALHGIYHVKYEIA